MRHVHPFEDTDITWERMDEWYTANLVNGLGNLVARVMKMAETNGVQLAEGDATAHALEDITPALDRFNAMEAMDHIWSEIGGADEKITATEPFKVIKTDPERGKTLIGGLLTELRHIGTALEAFMPETSKTILKAIAENKKPENLFSRLAE